MCWAKTTTLPTLVLRARRVLYMFVLSSKKRHVAQRTWQLNRRLANAFNLNPLSIIDLYFCEFEFIVWATREWRNMLVDDRCRWRRWMTLGRPWRNGCAPRWMDWMDGWMSDASQGTDGFIYFVSCDWRSYIRSCTILQCAMCVPSTWFVILAHTKLTQSNTWRWITRTFASTTLALNIFDRNTSPPIHHTMCSTYVCGSCSNIRLYLQRP